MAAQVCILLVLLACSMDALSLKPPCPKLLCPPHMRAIDAGKDTQGCPITRCCPHRLLGCIPGTKQTKVGSDGKGCPLFKCVPDRKCPLPDIHTLLTCPPWPMGRIIHEKDANGCDTFRCIGCAAKGCPPSHKQMLDGLDKNGCPKMKCQPPCPLISFHCPPGSGTKVKVGKDKNGCRTFECVTACPPMVLQCPPDAKQVEDGKDKSGCPLMKCARCPMPR